MRMSLGGTEEHQYYNGLLSRVDSICSCVVTGGRGATGLGIEIHDPLRYLTPPGILEDIITSLQSPVSSECRNKPVHVHFLPVEDLPALRVTAFALGTLTGEPFYVHLTLDLEIELQSDQCYSLVQFRES